MGKDTDIEANVAGHRARNRELVALIERKGGNLRVDRTVDLHFWAFNEIGANALAAALRECGLRNVIANISAKDEEVWNVEGQVFTAVVQVVDPVFVEKFVRLAAVHDAEFDGWGTSL